MSLQTPKRHREGTTLDLPRLNTEKDKFFFLSFLIFQQPSSVFSTPTSSLRKLNLRISESQYHPRGPGGHHSHHNILHYVVRGDIINVNINVGISERCLKLRVLNYCVYNLILVIKRNDEQQHCPSLLVIYCPLPFFLAALAALRFFSSSSSSSMFASSVFAARSDHRVPSSSVDKPSSVYNSRT